MLSAMPTKPDEPFALYEHHLPSHQQYLLRMKRDTWERVKMKWSGPEHVAFNKLSMSTRVSDRLVALTMIVRTAEQIENDPEKWRGK